MFCNCGKKIKQSKSGKCKNCFNKQFYEKRECISCKKEILPRGPSKNECRSCYDWRKRNENIEKHNKKRRDYRRKRKDKSLIPPSKRLGLLGHVDKKLGYKSIVKRGHPNVKNKKGRIFEHVFVMSEHLGRPLRKKESVHHKNGIRHDNRIENLELWDCSHPSGQRVQDKIDFYIDFLEKHGYIVIKNMDDIAL